MLCAGGVAAPMALHGAKGEVLFQKRTSPFGTPKRKAGAFRFRPLHPLTTKREGRSPSFLDYPPRSSDGAALLRSPLWLSTKLQLFYFDTKSVFLMDRNFFFLHPHKIFTAFRIRL